jgi:alcohol dehydrogenase
MALSAVGLIFDNLRVAYSDGGTWRRARRWRWRPPMPACLHPRQRRLRACHRAPVRRPYHTPHGLANAIMLPLVLKYSLPAVTDRLALLAVRAKLGKESEGEEVLAQKFLDAVEQLNRDLGIPTFLAALKESDIPQLAEAACREAHTGYPVPRYMTQAVCEGLIRQVLLPPAPKNQPRRRSRPGAAKKPE